jgi:hypothetical protein
MKIKITETINVDAEAWAYEFGVDKSEVRDDVKAYFNNWLQQQVENLGLDEVNFGE